MYYNCACNNEDGCMCVYTCALTHESVPLNLNALVHIYQQQKPYNARYTLPVSRGTGGGQDP